MRPRVSRHRADERGAAAMEFALVSLILIPLVLGMIQYGLFFNDYMQVRQGVRQAARDAVVQSTNVSGISTTGCTASFAAKLACYARTSTVPVSGNVTSYVTLIDSSGNPTTTWARGNTLVVCAVVSSAARNAGIVPMPNGGYVKAKTAMSIEKDSTNSTLTPNPSGFPLASDASTNDPTNVAWTSWCKV